MAGQPFANAEEIMHMIQVSSTTWAKKSGLDEIIQECLKEPLV